MLDDNGTMQEGQRYTAHFVSLGLVGVFPDRDSVISGLRGDSNFQNPAVSISTSSLDVTFDYAGQGSTIGDAGTEIANVINSNKNLVSDSVAYRGMDSGESVGSSSGNQLPLTGILYVVGGLLILVIVLNVFTTVKTVKAAA